MKQEYEAMLAGVPLLPAAEQQEFFEAVVRMRNAMVTDGLNRLAAGVAAAPIDKRVAKFVQLRDARAANNKEADTMDQAFKAALEAVEASLIAACLMISAKPSLNSRFGSVESVSMSAMTWAG